MTALVFIVPTVAYPVSVFVSNKYFSHVGSKAKMSTGLFIIGVSMFILGPVGFTKIPSSILITILGISGIGAGLGLSMVPALPDMVNFATEQLPHIESFMISDRVSSLINLFMYIGKGVFAPIAGVLTDEYNFKNAMGMIGVVILLYAVYFRMTSIKMRSIKSLKSSTLLRENEMKEAKSSFYLLEEDEV
jgi:MFS family permease